MNRLFINLYLVIIIGLLSINFISEQLWQQFVESEHSENQQWQHLEKIVKVLPLLNNAQKQPNESIISTLSAELDIPIKTASIKDYSWLEDQQQKLMAGQVVHNYDEHDNVIFYIKLLDEPLIYQLGPFSRDVTVEERFQLLKWLFLCFSYLLLAGVIFLWTRPLWRDLKQLTNMASAIADGKLDVTVYDHSHSPIKQIVTTFKDMAHRIIRLLSDQKQLVNAVSHELRTPLSRLKFSLAMLEGVNEEEHTEMVQDVSEIESLIDEMLSYARLENINQDLSMSSVDLSSLITNQVTKLNRLNTTNIKWQKTKPYFYNCNAHLIERAIQNLATNAQRYAKSTVEISLVTFKNHLEIIIDDDGEGISKKNREEIFKPFFQLEEHRNKGKSQKNGGFGLGLAIVQRICEWHKATCTVSESPSGGCRFIISLAKNQSIKKALKQKNQP